MNAPPSRGPNGLLARLRANAGAAVVNGAFRSLSSLGRLHPRARRAHGEVEVVRDVPYRDTGSPAHRLDVYRARDATGPLPVLLYAHGGAFRILSKDTHWLMGLGFAREGFLVFNINYRLAPKHPYPAAIEDACAALAWLEANAPRYGGDLSRLAFAGESAGANLALALALATSYRRPEPFARAAFDTGLRARAVLPLCGIFQVSDTARFARRKRSLSTFVADRLHEVTEGYLGPATPHPVGGFDLADPLLVLERGERPDRPLPPVFTAVGTRDPLLDDTRRLERALGHLSVPCRAVYYPGEIHAFHAMVWRANALQCWQESFEFLRTAMEGASAAEVIAEDDAREGRASFAPR